MNDYRKAKKALADIYEYFINLPYNSKEVNEDEIKLLLRKIAVICGTMTECKNELCKMCNKYEKKNPWGCDGCEWRSYDR